MADEGDATVALGNQVFGGDTRAFEIVDAHERHGLVDHRLVHCHHGRQSGFFGVLAKAIGQMAGEENQPVRLVGADEAQIVGFPAGIILGIADQQAIAALAGLGFEADQDVGEIGVTDIGGKDQNHVGAPHAQRAGHGIGGVAGAGNGLRDLAARGVGDLGRLVDGPTDGGNGYPGQGRDIFYGCQLMVLHLDRSALDARPLRTNAPLPLADAVSSATAFSTKPITYALV